MFNTQIGHPNLLHHEVTININLLEIIFGAFLVFEIGFIMGKKWETKKFIKILLANQVNYLFVDGDRCLNNKPTLKQKLLALKNQTLLDVDKVIKTKSIGEIFFQEQRSIETSIQKISSDLTQMKQNLVLTHSKRTIQEKKTLTKISSFSTCSLLEQVQTLKTIKPISKIQDQNNNVDQNTMLQQIDSMKTLKASKILDFHKSSFQRFCQNEKFISLFQVIQKIGQGGHGEVYKVLNKIKNKSYAIKKIYLNNLDKNDLLSEATILGHIEHNNIVKYHTWWIEEATEDQRRQFGYNIDFIHPQLKLNQQFQQFSDSDDQSIVFQNILNQPQIKINQHRTTNKKVLHKHQKKLFVLYIQMQLYQDGTLCEYIGNKNRQVNPSFAFSIVKQLLKAIQFLHEHQIVHRDIKPSNIFLNEKQIIIADFGLSMKTDSKQNKGYKLNSKLGTPLYMAPQLKNDSFILNPQLLDIYSVGIIYFELLNKFKSEHERTLTLKNLQKGKISMTQYDNQKQLIHLMLQECDFRISAKELLESVQFKQLQNIYCKQV